MRFGWVAGPVKSLDSVYLRTVGGLLQKKATSGMFLGPKDPVEEHDDRINHCLVHLLVAEREKINKD